MCNCIYRDEATAAVGHWGVIQLLSRHGVYVVEDGEIAVTDSALQQKKPFRKVLNVLFYTTKRNNRAQLLWLSFVGQPRVVV